MRLDEDRLAGVADQSHRFFAVVLEGELHALYDAGQPLLKRSALSSVTSISATAAANVDSFSDLSVDRLLTLLTLFGSQRCSLQERCREARFALRRLRSSINSCNRYEEFGGTARIRYWGCRDGRFVDEVASTIAGKLNRSIGSSAIQLLPAM